jgi:hypothetical protein
MQRRPEKPDRKGKGQSVRENSPNDRGPEIDSELQTHIGRHLKASYDDILGQEVPDRFRDLLQQLEAKEKDSGGPKGRAG